ncbi:hypothetical protein [Pseudoxanthomonas putridarboris]|uniref:Uncharacterized protein n=1 Tax=Pseudoxanthomonas putridarboris TaxID=752605 RepID=A0ABU9J2K8_9GAMM
MTRTTWVLAVSLLVALIAPLAWGMVEWLRSRRHAPQAASTTTWQWKAVLGSMLLYVLAFNLTFFVQELFLVVPKALTPGLQPTLYHNNHGWEGEHPLAALFQGTGALATFVVGLLCLWAARRGAGRTPARRMALVWMAYCGLLMALPQVVIGALSGASDVGMAMDYLGLSLPAKTLAAGIALAAIPWVALSLRPPVLEVAEDVSSSATPATGAKRIFMLVTLPALLAVVAILPFRVPREWLEVVLLPVLVTVPGIAWMQAGAWRAKEAMPSVRGRWPLAGLLLATLALLVVFQWILRPGIAFH